MEKIFSFRYALLLVIFLLSLNEPTNQDINPVNTNPIINNEYTLNALGTTIYIEENTESILSKLGNPSRIIEIEKGFEFYIYNNNYNKLLFVAINDDKVVGFYTDSVDFKYLGISPSSSLEDVNGILGTDYPMDYIIAHKAGTHTLHVLIDEIGTKKVTGILVLDEDVEYIGYSAKSIKDTELLVYDLTNSMRKRNGLPTLAWSSTAAKAARKHSTDMANNNYFNHYNLYGKSPGDRLREEGIYYKNMSENIIAGYGGAIISTHGWFNSPEHRENILNKDYRCLGVGYTYQEESHFKTYITQMFYR